MWVRKALTILFLLAVAIGVPVANARAASITYTFDTSALDPSAGLYSLDFQLVSNEAPTTNSATLTNFDLGGGSLLSTSAFPAEGGTSGSVGAPPLTLTAVAFFNAFTADFIPGSFVSFALDLTNFGPVNTPDRFTFGILLNSVEIGTTDSSGLNKMLAVNLVGGTAPLQVDVFEASTAVPEPGTLTLLAAGLFGTSAAARRRRKSGSK